MNYKYIYPNNEVFGEEQISNFSPFVVYPVFVVWISSNNVHINNNTI